MLDLITIGDTTIDTFLVLDNASLTYNKKTGRPDKLCLNYADKICIQETQQSVGGGAANVASGAAKLGLNAAIITEVGADLNGHVATHELTCADVDTSMVKRIKGKQTRYSMVLNFNTERTILSYHPTRSYTLPKMPNTKWIYYTSLGKSFEKLQSKLIAYLKKHPGTFLACNPGSYQLKSGLTKIKKILPYTNVLFVNKEEAALILGKKMNLKKTCQAFHDIGVMIVVITDSTRGAYACNGEHLWHMPIYPLKPVAKTGAGDAFASGFLSALIHERGIDEALEWGTANAGSVVQQMGAQNGLCNRRKIQSIRKKYTKIKPKEQS